MLAGRKLLIADHSATIRKIVDLTFSDEGVQVTMVASGDEAVEKLDAEDVPDIVLAHVSLPGRWNGYQLCKFIKSDWRFRHIPVLLLVGTFEPFNEAEARRVGANDVLTKPFQSIRDLVNRVGALVSGRSAEEKRDDASLPGGTLEEANQSTVAYDKTQEFAVPPLPRDPSAPDETTAPVAAEQSAREITDVGSADDRMIEVTAAETPMTGVTATGGLAIATPSDQSAFVSNTEEEQQPMMAPSFDSESESLDTTLSDEQPVFLSETARGEEIVRQNESTTTSESEVNASSDAEPHGTQNEDMFMSEPETRPSILVGEESENTATGGNFSSAAMNDSFRADSTTLDDALLDLGEIEPAGASVSGNDNFILDLSDDEPLTAPPQVAYSDAETMEVPDPFGSQFEGAFAAPSSPPSPLPPPSLSDVSFNETRNVGSTFFDEQVSERVVRGSMNAGDMDTIAEQVVSPPALANVAPGAQAEIELAQLSPAAIELIARRAVELLSEQVVQEIAWEVVPQLAELMIKRKLDGEDTRGD